MRTFTESEMAGSFCPFSGDPCLGCKCVACEQVYNAVVMADHSGGSLRMREIANQRRRTSMDIRETRSGGETVLTLDAEYTCRRVYPEDTDA